MKDLPAVPGQIVRFVSDLHLGHKKSAIRNVEQLRFLLKDCDILVVCGDFTETREQEFSEAAQRLRQSFEALCSEEGVQLILLAGNHDPMEEESILTCAESRVAAFHGHCLFKQVSPWGREYLNNKALFRKTISQFRHADTDLDCRMELARTIAMLVAPSPDADETCHSRWLDFKPVRFFLHACWPPERPFQILRAWLMMRNRVKKFHNTFLPKASVICYGHLHRRDIFHSGGKLYINLGAFFQYAAGYAVDVRDNTLEVREISGDGWGRTVRRHSLV